MRPEDRDRKIGDKVIDDFKFIEKLIESLTAEKIADPKKVFLAGLSNGAFLANVFADKHPDKVAGIGIVAGTLPIEHKSSLF